VSERRRSGSASATREVGGRVVHPIGLGAMPMSLEGRPDDARCIATIHAALDAGVTLIDTADAYSIGGDDTGHNERLVARALRSWGGHRDEVVVATKGGHVRPGDGSWAVDGRPEHLRAACEASLRRLEVDVIDLYQFHRPDPEVPFLESVGALAELRDAGKIRLAGLSNVTVEQIDAARDVIPIASVQNQFSPRFRSSASELVRCGELGIAFLAWSPLGGIASAAGLGAEHTAFADVAARHGVSPQRVALAWCLAHGDVVIPIPGSTRPETILDSVAAADLVLDDDDLAALGTAAPPLRGG
jgi:aryl-alcohol dehydrogenase-like predicted oxidoreductase